MDTLPFKPTLFQSFFWSPGRARVWTCQNVYIHSKKRNNVVLRPFSEGISSKQPPSKRTRTGGSARIFGASNHLQPPNLRRVKESSKPVGPFFDPFFDPHMLRSESPIKLVDMPAHIPPTATKFSDLDRTLTDTPKVYRAALQQIL